MVQYPISSFIPVPKWTVSQGRLEFPEQFARPKTNSPFYGTRSDEANGNHQSRIPIPVRQREFKLPRSLETTSGESSSSNHSSRSSLESPESFPMRKQVVKNSPLKKNFLKTVKPRVYQHFSKPPIRNVKKQMDEKWAIQLNEPYLTDIMIQSLRAEKKYKDNSRFKCQPLGKMEHPRKQLVEWIIATGKKYKYSDETLHQAVYIIDAYIRIKYLKITPSYLSLLGLASFHLAGKMEEVMPVKLALIIPKYFFLKKFQCEDVVFMEAEIIDVLKLDICPPTCIFFADLSINGQIDFPSERVKRLTMKLTHAILLESIKEYSLSKVVPSMKARIAVQIALKNITVTIKRQETKGDVNGIIISKEIIHKSFVLFCKTINNARMNQSRNKSYKESMMKSNRSMNLQLPKPVKK